jgi:hypothetical protein
LLAFGQTAAASRGIGCCDWKMLGCEGRCVRRFYWCAPIQDDVCGCWLAGCLRTCCVGRASYNLESLASSIHKAHLGYACISSLRVCPLRAGKVTRTDQNNQINARQAQLPCRRAGRALTKRNMTYSHIQVCTIHVSMTRISTTRWTASGTFRGLDE